jgi:hypothetical protein
MIPTNRFLSNDDSTAWWVPEQLTNAHGPVFKLGNQTYTTTMLAKRCGEPACHGGWWYDKDDDPQCHCEQCDGTGRHTFEIEVERPCDTLANALRCDPATQRVHVLDVLPIFDSCPDEKPANHVCHAYYAGEESGMWWQHRSFDHHDWTERQVTLPATAALGMWVVWLAVHGGES